VKLVVGFLPGYGHFVRTAASLQWDEAAVDLRPDAEAWPELSPSRRRRILALLAGFWVGETRVAEQLEPFAAATRDATAGTCFRLQARDEARHARFFDRAAAEVARVPGAEASERGEALRPLVDPAFLSLFEERLPRVARELAGDADGLGGAIALYHLVLEGVVFSAGQLAMLALLEEDEALPGLRRGVELVLRDERWHIGFGARSLALIGASPEAAAGLLAAAEPALDAWGDVVDPPLRARVLELHRRRLRATGLLAGAVAA
jgi:ribonucleoside-diphosphate reductase beta chain